MTCTNTTKIQAKIDKYEALLLLAYEAYEGSLGGGIKSYELDTGGGEASQRATRFDPGLLLKDIMNLEKYLEWLEDKYSGVGVFNLKLRRQAAAIIC